MKTNDLLSEQNSLVATRDLAATPDLLATLESLAKKRSDSPIGFPVRALYLFAS